MSHDDFEKEALPGLPAVPPAGETILWQGAPHWPTVARRVMHIDLVAIYLTLVLGWRLVSAYEAGLSAREIAASAITFVALSSVALGILTWIAWGIGHTTVYTITSRRIALRFGIALPVTFNLPFREIVSADARDLGGNRGDIALRLTKGTRLAFLVMWPHVRPWRINAPQPMLRAVPELSEVATLLTTALAADLSRKSAEAERTSTEPASVPTPIARPQLIAAE